MNTLEAALADLSSFLEDEAVPYMVIGGFANLRWGRARLTQDLDVTIQLGDDRLPEFLEHVSRRLVPLAPSPLDFARHTFVIPVTTPTGVRADLILAGHPWEDEAIARAVEVPIGTRTSRFCTAEDLVILKLVSERPRDREDVEGVILRQGPALDRGYLDRKVRELAAGLERPQILDFYRGSLERAGLS